MTHAVGDTKETARLCNTLRLVVSELFMGWVDPLVELDRVEIFQFLVGWVGLGPL